MTKKHDFESEAEMCQLFVDYARTMGWKVFPETSGHDMLLVATDEVKTINAVPGDQIGVQAKLKDNLEVLHQAMPSEWGHTGPHYHAVLVPVADDEFKKIARRLGILVFQATRANGWGRNKKLIRSDNKELYYLPINKKHYYTNPDWHPEIELWTPPGVKSPSSVTPWKVDAVRICLAGEAKGYLTSDDFKKISMSMTRWVRFGWIVDSGERMGKLKKFVFGSDPDNLPPHMKWPEIAAQLRADEETAEKLSNKTLRALGANLTNT